MTLSLYTASGAALVAAADAGAAAQLADAVWLDLLQPSPGEVALVERATGLHLPSLEDISEIESSSRLRAEHNVVYLSAPLLHRTAAGEPRNTPVGFLLSENRLVTVRFEQLGSFDTLARTPPTGTAPEIFAELIEAIVDRLADILEQIAGELDTLSHRLFRSGPIDRGRHRRPAREARDLRVILRRVGAGGDLASRIRDGLLGLSRMVPYVEGMAAAWLPEAVKPRLETLRHDLASLSDYDAHLLNKVQLLLDATLGLINVEQNDIIKVLTIVSVVGVPPTLVASMYGMNFKNIPEYDWSFGYEWGLALIAISAIAPLLWFKWRGWF